MSTSTATPDAHRAAKRQERIVVGKKSVPPSHCRRRPVTGVALGGTYISKVRCPAAAPPASPSYRSNSRRDTHYLTRENLQCKCSAGVAPVWRRCSSGKPRTGARAPSRECATMPYTPILATLGYLLSPDGRRVLLV